MPLVFPKCSHLLPEGAAPVIKHLKENVVISWEEAKRKASIVRYHLLPGNELPDKIVLLS
jgi:hypothetical protein